MVEPTYLVGLAVGTKNAVTGLYVRETKSVEILVNDLGNTCTPSWVSFEPVN